MSDTWYEIFGYQEDPRSSWERLEDNPEVRAVLTKKEAKIWDQIFHLTKKICQELERSEDLFFLARPFLVEGFRKGIYEQIMKERGEKLGTIHPSSEDKTQEIEINITQYILELNDLWDRIDLQKIKSFFN